MIKNPQVGDIVRARSTERNNLFVLWDVSRKHYVQGLLLHTCPELATDEDVVLATGSFLNGYRGTVMPYPLVLCCDLYGQLLRTQVDKVVAHIDFPAGGNPLFRPARIAEALGGYRGMPLAGPVDPRWQEKVRLLEEELRPLTYPFWEGFRW